MTLSIISSVLFLGAVLLFAIKLGCGQNRMDAWDNKINFAAVMAVLLAGSFVFRLILGYNSMGYEGDINLFKTWGSLINESGYSKVYDSGIFLDYPPGYLYVLGWLDQLKSLFGLTQESQMYTLIIKLPAIIADVICGYVVYRIGRKLTNNAEALFASAAFLFCPAVLINSTVWGQIDSFCLLILLASIWLLQSGRVVPAAVLYGLAVICKPQMLIFAPLYLFYTVYRKNYKGLVLGVLAALLTILAVATPFVKNFNYLWLIGKYRETMDYYSYYTINAYNIWGVLGKNWIALPKNGFILTCVTWFGPLLATALCGFVMYKGKDKKGILFCAPAVLMSTVYIFSVKMHERYLFTALLFILLTYFFTQNRRFLYIFGGLSAVHFINVAYVLYLNNTYVSPTSIQILALSAAHILLYVWLIIEVMKSFVFEKDVRFFKNNSVDRRERRPMEKIHGIVGTDADRHIRKQDFILIAVITAVYAVVAFWNLGDNTTANTSWTPSAGESVVLMAGEDISSMTYLPGIGKNESSNSSRVGINITVELSSDGENWIDAGTVTDGYVYDWNELSFDDIKGRYIRITSLGDDTVINEVAFKSTDGKYFAEIIPISGDYKALIDEQGSVPLHPNYMNSTYFDEIYHARTAYEYILGVEAYENTHPTLGKLIISLGITIFGMNPFGWRFMGALFGVLMLPILYHILKRLFGNAFLSSCGVILFAFDFMHFTQTRIATIDTYAVFFLLLMYDAMLIFMQKDIRNSSVKELLLPLLLCGIFTGLGIAAKWTAAYGAVGLAVLFFVKLFLGSKGDDSTQKSEYLRKCVKLCLWCVLFFILIPFAIYFAAFLPLTLQPQNRYDVWGRFWAYQFHMYDYHSKLVAEHYFASPWYEWPLDIRNIWYEMSYNPFGKGGVSSISCLGNPILWWSGLASLIASAVLFIKKRSEAAWFAIIGFASVYVPWMLVPRLTFVYHYFTAVPFIIIALVYIMSLMKERPAMQATLGKDGILARIPVYAVVFSAFVAVNLILFAVFFPVISGAQSTTEYIESLQWLPNWYFG